MTYYYVILKKRLSSWLLNFHSRQILNSEHCNLAQGTKWSWLDLFMTHLCQALLDFTHITEMFIPYSDSHISDWWREVLIQQRWQTRQLDKIFILIGQAFCFKLRKVLLVTKDTYKDWPPHNKLCPLPFEATDVLETNSRLLFCCWWKVCTVVLKMDDWCCN